MSLVCLMMSGCRCCLVVGKGLCMIGCIGFLFICCRLDCLIVLCGVMFRLWIWVVKF